MSENRLDVVCALDYRHSLFDEEPRGSDLDRLFGQPQQTLADTEGGLFVVIGRKDESR